MPACKALWYWFEGKAAERVPIGLQLCCYLKLKGFWLNVALSATFVAKQASL